MSGIPRCWNRFVWSGWLGLTTAAVDFIFGHGSVYFYVQSRNLIPYTVDSNNNNMSHRGKGNQIGSKALSCAVIKGRRGKTGFRSVGGGMS